MFFNDVTIIIEHQTLSSVLLPLGLLTCPSFIMLFIVASMTQTLKVVQVQSLLYILSKVDDVMYHISLLYPALFIASDTQSIVPTQCHLP